MGYLNLFELRWLSHFGNGWNDSTFRPERQLPCGLAATRYPAAPAIRPLRFAQRKRPRVFPGAFLR